MNATDSKTYVGEAAIPPVTAELNRIRANNQQIGEISEALSNLRKHLASILENHIVARDPSPEAPPLSGMGANSLSKEPVPETNFIASLRDIRKDGGDNIENVWEGICGINRLLDSVIIP